MPWIKTNCECGEPVTIINGEKRCVVCDGPLKQPALRRRTLNKVLRIREEKSNSSRGYVTHEEMTEGALKARKHTKT